MPHISTVDIYIISCSDATNFYWWNIYNQSAAQMPHVSTDDISTISCSDATHFYWWHIYNQLKGLLGADTTLI
jgi:hypothetical protein